MHRQMHYTKQTKISTTQHHERASDVSKIPSPRRLAPLGGQRTSGGFAPTTSPPPGATVAADKAWWTLADLKSALLAVNSLARDDRIDVHEKHYLKTLIREHDVRVGAAVQKYEVAHGVDEFFAFLVEVAKDDLAAQGTDTSGPTTAWQ